MARFEGPLAFVPSPTAPALPFTPLHSSLKGSGVNSEALGSHTFPIPLSWSLVTLTQARAALPVPQGQGICCYQMLTRSLITGMGS